MAWYVLDEVNNKIEVTDKVLTALVEQLKCCVSGEPYKMAFVPQAKYNELAAAGQVLPNTIYYITDDTTADDIDKQLKKLLGYFDGGVAKIAQKVTTNYYTVNGLTQKITKAGLYAINVTFYSYTYSAIMSIENLQTDVSTVLFSQNIPNTGDVQITVTYDAATTSITVADPMKINTVRLITEY